MAQLTPVDYDPFAASRTPVDHDPWVGIDDDAVEPDWHIGSLTPRGHLYADIPHRNDAIDEALPARWARDIVLPSHVPGHEPPSSGTHSGPIPQLTYPASPWDRPTFSRLRGWHSGSNDPISDGPAETWKDPINGGPSEGWWSRIGRTDRASPAERGFISNTPPNVEQPNAMSEFLKLLGRQ